MNDTIFALATPIGRSAVATIRISGLKALETVNKISLNMPQEHATAKLNTILLNNKEHIDQTITTIFKSPMSYTGEDVVEISTHGGSAVINKIIGILGRCNNLRLAEPGEFTRRAFENNKLDLTQVEAISDLVNSETEAQRKQAVNQLSGLFSNRIKKWSDRIIKNLANIEAAIDFSDQDLPKDLIIKVKEQNKNIINEIESYLGDNKIGEKIRSGFIVAILGKTNVGKSSFINKIAQRDLAIVTDEPGTTRDAIELFADFKGLPVKIFDTAGIRKTKNRVEYLGVEKSYLLSDIADINLVFLENEDDINKFKNFNNKIFVQSKSDINEKIYSNNNVIYYISSKTGEGIDKLIDKIYLKLLPNSKIDTSVSRERHRIILKNTICYLKKSIDLKNIDVIAEDVRLALNEISKISGKKDVEDILDIIFNDFCIGK